MRRAKVAALIVSVALLGTILNVTPAVAHGGCNKDADVTWWYNVWTGFSHINPDVTLNCESTHYKYEARFRLEGRNRNTGNWVTLATSDNPETDCCDKTIGRMEFQIGCLGDGLEDNRVRVFVYYVRTRSRTNNLAHVSENWYGASFYVDCEGWAGA
jgi:hypothetical protein